MIQPKKLLLASAVVLALASTPQAMAQQRHFNVPAQPAAHAIPEFASQAGVQIVAPAGSLQDIHTPAIRGEMDARDALRRLLQGTGLEIRSDDGGIITLRRKQAAGGTPAQGTGYITGSVFDPATGGFLRNAAVRITSAAGTRTVYSGERGEFALADVPAGEVTISVSYAGFGEVEKTVRLDDDGRERVDIELYSTLAGRGDGADTTLDTLQVVGAREGDARAIMEQRASMNITNTLSADSYGEIIDGNPGEFLKNMPGVDFDVTADDVPRNISLHGLPQQYTGVTINGVKLAGVDANDGAAASRTFSFEQSALTGVDSITVYTTSGADMDANAPAGTIDIRTRKAFDGKGRRITVDVSGATHAALWDKYRSGPREGGYDRKFLPGIKASYADVFLDGRLGVAAGISNSTSLVEHVQTTANRNYIPTAASPEPYAVTSIVGTNYEREYNRRAASLGVDFKATDQLILSLMASASRGDIEAAQPAPTFTTNARSRGVQGDPALDFTTRSTATATTLSTASTYNYKFGHSRNLIPSFEWSTEKFRLAGNLFYSNSDSQYDSTRKGQVQTFNPVTSTGNFSASRSSQYAQDWNIVQTSGPDWSLPSSYTFSGPATVTTRSGKTAEARNTGGSLDLSIFQDIGSVPVTWKTGLKLSTTRYAYENTSAAHKWTYTGPMGKAELLEHIRSDNVFTFGRGGMTVTTLNGGSLYMPSLTRLYQMMQANPEQWTNTLTAANWYDAYVANSRRLDEQIGSAYVMATADFSARLKGQFGVRWEQTRNTGYEFDPLSAQELAAAGHAVDPASGRATTIDGLKYQYLTRDRIERRSRYDDFFPSVSLKYSFDNGLDLIAGYNRAIQRPDVGVIAGVWSVAETEDGTVVTAPNVNLKPEYSDNFALRAVKYWEPVGLVALNYYHNRIRNGIVARNLSAQEFGYSGDQYADATFSTSANQSDRAISVDAWQLEFNHAMDYLPGVLRGLTVRGAYMYANPSEPLPRVASQVAQFGVGWKYGRVRLSLNSVYSNEKDRGQTGNIATPGGTITQSQPFIPYAEVNLSGSYTFIRKTRDNVLGLEAFFSVNNLLRRHRGTWYANDEIWPGSSGHHSQIDIYSGQKASIGIRARF